MTRVPASKTLLREHWIAVLLAALLTVGCGGHPTSEERLPGTDSSDDRRSATDSHEPVSNLSSRPNTSDEESDLTPLIPHAGEPVSTGGRARISDNRPDINELRLRECGIIRLESQRLRLLTDLPKEKVAHLPPLADQLYEHLSAYFGKLPPAEDGSEFQVTGHIIDDESKFTAAGLLPEARMGFSHGRHFDYEFWMYGQKTDYFLRHLMLHEFTHCFMTCESGMRDIPPLWYIEGMAEYFATHAVAEGKASFGLLPDTTGGFDGWGRIAELKRSFWVRQRQPLAESTEPVTTILTISSLDEIIPMRLAEFKSDYQYASSWAVCWLLESHPEYKSLSQQLRSVRRRAPFQQIQQAIDAQLLLRLRKDWLLVVESLIEGFDPAHSLPVHHSKPWTLTDAPVIFELRADRGWCDTGLRLNVNDSVTLTCEGRVQVNDLPEPWQSEPQGVSIEYHEQLPLGQVVGILIGQDGQEISGRIAIGRGRTITVTQNCSLWLQINESESGRRDNSGSIRVTLAAR